MDRTSVMLAIMCVACRLAAQAPAEFEVASIKPYVSEGNPAGEGSSTKALPGGRLSAQNVTVRKLIRNAFGVDDFQIAGAPGWIDSVSYDIEAKTVGGVEITRDNFPPLLRWLLENRFQLQFHRETQEMTEYALEVGKNGAKVKPDTGDSKPSLSTNSRSGFVTLNATKISMQDFAGTLRRQLGRTVVDKTGLQGEFDFDMKWSSDEAPEASGASIFTALQELGFRLVSTKGPVEIIVIDRVEKASEN
jgi:uncharacterized protein (TIGR03435 family)